MNKNLDIYTEDHSTPSSDLLMELERVTALNTSNPRMCSGYLQGRVLSFISKILRPSYILELGTFTGYATLCLAEGLLPKGKIITLEADEEITKIAQEFFNRSEHKNKITLMLGQAIDIIPGLPDGFDLVFIDADKANYSAYLDMLVPKMKSGSIILADNVLWSGKILMEKKDKNTKALDDFNKKVLEDERLENMILPIRDGINCIRVK
jgi:caffeoyl-CoA O-methyltransferase